MYLLAKLLNGEAHYSFNNATDIIIVKIGTDSLKISVK